MIIVGHRGAPHRCLENTQRGFQYIVESGIERIETDIQVSSDGICYIFHDDNLKRMTGEDRIFSQTPSSTIDLLSLSDGSRIPRLTEIITQFSGQVDWNLEIKSKSVAEADIILDTLNNIATSSKIIISSFYHDLVKHLKTRDTRYDYALLWDRLPNDFNHIEKSMSESTVSIIHPEFKLINKDFLKLCEKNKWLIVPYISMRDEELTDEYIDKVNSFKLEGICTNFPVELKKIYHEK